MSRLYQDGGGSGPSRRAVLRSGTLLLAGLATGGRMLAAEVGPKPVLRVGLVTDVHYADKPMRINRYYRESLGKLAEAVEAFNEAEVDFAVCLGDLIDAADSVEREVSHLRKIERVFERVRGERHYVLGNHCVDTLTKGEFAENSGAGDSHYSFDAGGFHFVVIDSCYNGDGEPYGRNNFEWTDANVPEAQLDWLRADLAGADRPTLVFAHQRLDLADDNPYAVNNASAVRRVLSASPLVEAVFQGHSHRNEYRRVGTIHYTTLVAMVEGSGAASSGYAIMSLHEDGSIRVEGFRRQEDYRW